MERFNRVVINLIFCIQVLLIFLLFVENRINLPPWLQVAGRMHPLVLHLPIGGMVFLVALMLIVRPVDQAFTRVIHFGLLLTSLSASTAALFGFFLSLQGDYGPDALWRHKIGGVALSFLCYGALLWFRSGSKRSVFYGLGIFSCMVLVFTGHTGAILTHGDNFLLAPISKPKVVLTAENASVYKFAIEPILEKKCFSCHNESKAKGGLVMTSADRFRRGGDDGTPWVAGDPQSSRMIKAFYLPISDDKHMPPDGKVQLTTVEIGALKAWIKSGADFEKKLADFEREDSLQVIVASLMASEAPPVVEVKYTFNGASGDVIRDLNTPFRTIFPLYQESPALQADFFVRKSFEAKSLKELKVIRDQLVVLNLSKMPVTDEDLADIGLFHQLEHLNLNFSAIQGAGLRALGSLEHLQSISLSGTAVKAKDLGTLLELPSLREVFVWNTKISESQRDSLSAHHPDVNIITSQFKDESILKLSRPMLDNEGVMQPNDDIVLKHPMPGVTIRYTLDDTDPDTLTGLIYDHPLKFSETTVIRSRACKESWYCSDVFEATCFVAGLKPSKVELLTQPDPQYPGDGASSLWDGRKGAPDVLKEPSWLGYRNGPMKAAFTFPEGARPIKRVVLSYGRNLGAFSFPPQQVEVWGGADSHHLKLIESTNPVQPTGNMPQRVVALSISIRDSTYPYYEVTARPVEKLPQWHSGKGEKGWFFVDEIFFY